MKQRFILYRRGETFYCEDTVTHKQQSLRTKDANEAKTLLAVKNEAVRQPAMNLQIAQVYLQHGDGRILPKDYRQFVRGYAVTSYAAQGKTGDYVIFSDSAIRAATNQKQWYVTISRGRRGIFIFTTDKQQLRENIASSGNRQLAIELANSQNRPRRVVSHRLQINTNVTGL